jgi:protein tyrosine phosphatase (PTP) superfamily phosphohydrolase (DUF442 family)
LRIIRGRLLEQGLRPTFLWAADHAVRALSGAPIRGVSEVAPGLHVGGQFRRRGWRRLAARGVTGVVNMRIEYDDAAAGIAPTRYLHLPTVDDMPPTLAHLRAGVAFIRQEVEAGGGVYVHCASGVGRAPTMAAAYLVSTGLTPHVAWQTIRRVRPFVRPRPAQVARLTEYANLLVSGSQNRPGA